MVKILESLHPGPATNATMANFESRFVTSVQNAKHGRLGHAASVAAAATAVFAGVAAAADGAPLNLLPVVSPQRSPKPLPGLQLLQMELTPKPKRTPNTNR